MPANRSIADDLEQRFPNYKPVEALVSGAAGDAPVFRLPLHDLGWEFSDGFNIGKVIKGTFYYSTSDLEGLPKNLETEAKYSIDIYETRESNWAYISLYKPGSETELFAVFFGNDLHNVIAGSKLYHTYGLKGSWKSTSSYVVATAQVSKAENSTKFTITSPSVKSGIEFHCNREDSVYKSRIDASGVLTIKDRQNVHKASTVKWYPDHIIFYEDTNSARYSSAYFYPNDFSEKSLLGEETVGKEWGAAKWLDQA